jgi:hypothetical protein
MGFTVMLALAELSGSATLVAVTVTIWGDAWEVGAVYNPVPETVPTAGLTDQTTDESVAPVNVAAHC